MLYVFIESDESGAFEVRLSAVPYEGQDDRPSLLISWQLDELRANAIAQELANTLRTGGAEVQLH